MSQYPSDKYLFWKEEPKKRPWEKIPDTQEARQGAIENGAMFFTWNTFQENGQPEPVRFGDMPLDFDSEDLEEALKDLHALCFYHLPKLYGIDPHAIKYYISGKKGFHITIPVELFGAEDGDPCLPLIYKKIATLWKEQFQLKTLDLSLYCMGKGKMFRIANVKRGNGRFKVPITLDEVRIT